MKYIVSRTSDFIRSEKPFPNAEHGWVHYYATFKKGYDELSEYSKEHNRDFEWVDGRLRAVNKKPSEVWFAEIKDIQDFVDRHGKCVVFPVVCEEGFREIEIYDTYRE